MDLLRAEQTAEGSIGFILQSHVVPPWSHPPITALFSVVSKSWFVSQTVSRMTFSLAFSIFVLSCGSFQTPMHMGMVFLHGVQCLHTDDIVDFSPKLWTPRESDAVGLPRSPRRARRCRRHHPLGLLSIPAGLASRQIHLTRDFFSTCLTLCTHHIVAQGVAACV